MFDLADIFEFDNGLDRRIGERCIGSAEISQPLGESPKERRLLKTH